MPCLNSKTLQIPTQGVGVLYGESLSYKSLVAQTLAMNTAIDDNVLYMSEGVSPRRLQKRIQAWMALNGRSEIGRNMTITAPEHPDYTDAVEWMEFQEALSRGGVSPSLIIIDDFGYFLKGNPNSAANVNHALTFLEGLSDHYGCFVLIVCTAHKGRVKGLSLLDEVADVMIEVTKEDGNTLLTIKKHPECVEGNYTLRGVKIGESIALQWEPNEAR